MGTWRNPKRNVEGVSYLDDRFQEVEESEASYIRIHYSDGTKALSTIKRKLIDTEQKHAEKSNKEDNS